MKHSIGDKVWYIPYPKYIFAVLCTIKEINEKFNSYWLDEIVGHGTDDDDFLDSLEDVIEEFKDFMEEGGHSEEVITLEYFRDRQQKFVLRTWDKYIEKPWETPHPGFEPLPEKQEGIEWINITHVEEKQNG